MTVLNVDFSGEFAGPVKVTVAIALISADQRYRITIFPRHKLKTKKIIISYSYIEV